tara:strand:+ start:2699 stop:3019 length:321 start_codon:yes stop_codon:yes gene_type:complete
MTDNEWNKIIDLIKSNQIVLALQLGLGLGMSKVEIIKKYWLHTSMHPYKLTLSNHELWDYKSHGAVSIYSGDGSIISQHYDNFTHDEIVDKFINKLIKLIENESTD